MVASFAALLRLQNGDQHDGPKQEAVGKKPDMVGPMVKNLWKVDEVNAKRKGDGSPCERAEVGVNQYEVGDVGVFMPKARPILRRCLMSFGAISPANGGR